jgi:hypothetical protein
LGLLAPITLELVPFHVYALFPAPLPFFKCILEVIFCEGVKIAAFSVGETEKLQGANSLVKKKVGNGALL